MSDDDDEALIRHATSRSAVSICDLAEGDACIRGTVVELAPPFEAPLTGRACLLSDASARYRPPDGTRLERARRGVDFIVDDGTGLALIEPRAFEGALEHLHRGACERWSEPDVAQLALLHSFGMVDRDTVLAVAYDFRETILLPGARVIVFGRARLEPDPDGAARMDALRGLPPMRPIFTGNDEHPLLIVAV